MCGFIFDKGSAHWMNRCLSGDELRALADGRLDPKDVKNDAGLRTRPPDVINVSKTQWITDKILTVWARLK